MVKICIVCHREYSAFRLDQKFCSKTCKLRHHYANLKPLEERYCVVCGAPFVTVQPKRKYCSLTCHNIANKTGQVKVVVCTFCGKRFETTTLKRKFCCKDHAINAKKKRDLGRVR